MNEITPEQITEWRALAEAATPGLWVALGTSIGAEVDGCTCHGGIEPYGHEQYCGIDGPVAQGAEVDIAFIAAARAAVPALLDALDRGEREHVDGAHCVPGYKAGWEAARAHFTEGNQPHTDAMLEAVARAETAEANLAASMEAHAVTAGERDAYRESCREAERHADEAEAEVQRLREDVGAVVIGLNWERETRPDSQQSVEWLNLTLDRVVGHLRALLERDQ